MLRFKQQLIDENRSVWIAEESSEDTPLEKLCGNEFADLAIIGGGFTGVSAAWHLNRRFPNLRIVLLEAKTIGSGASGRSGGQALTGINGVEPADAERARRIYDVTKQGIDLIEQLVTEHSLDAGFSRRGCLEVFTAAKRAEAAHEHVEKSAREGIPLRWLPATALSLRGVEGAILDPAAGRVNGIGLLRGLRKLLVERGVTIWERTPALSIDEGSEIRVSTPEGEVRAKALVLATNVYGTALGYFRRGVLPLHSHVLATAPLSEAQWQSVGWGEHDGFSDDRDRVAYGCRTAGGRVVFGGGGNDAYAYSYGGATVFSGSADRAFEAIHRRLIDYMPGLAGVPIEHRWTGTVDLTLDRVCSMGVCGANRNVYHAVGYSGHGVSLAMLAGRVLCDLYAGNHEPWLDLPFHQRPLPSFPPEPLRWIGYQLYTRLTGRSPRRRYKALAEFSTADRRVRGP
jgi:gamma-glutamylputrescine oxidase